MKKAARLAVLFLALAAPACGEDGGDPEAVVGETAARLGEVRRLEITLVVRPRLALNAVERTTAVEGRTLRLLERLPVEDLVEDAELTDDGGTTLRVRGTLDVAGAVQRLRELGFSLPAAADAVSSARFDLETGKRDRLLRRLTVEGELGLAVLGASLRLVAEPG